MARSKLPVVSVTVQRLREVLSYDPETGLFTWRIRKGGTANPGTPAGCIQPHGYVRMNVDGHHYYAHRLAWLYVHGEWPANEIDHIDGDRSNNRIGNLREANRRQQLANTRRRSDNTSGFKGVSWHAAAGKWVAQISTDGRYIAIGYYNTPEEAHAAYCRAALDTFGHFARPK